MGKEAGGSKDDDIRKIIEVMIATYCIGHALPLLYSNCDFDPMVLHLGLHSPLNPRINA